MKDPLARAMFWLAVFVAVFALASMAGSVFGWAPFSAFASAGQPDKYEIRSRLLMEATDEVGACGPDQAARVWADGLKKRSAALQYAVMTKALKAKYAADLEKTFPNWVTGVSSPWVDDYGIVTADRTAEGSWSYTLLFRLKTSTGPAGDYFARLTVVKDGDDWTWRVSKVDADKELAPYTGFTS